MKNLIIFFSFGFTLMIITSCSTLGGDYHNYAHLYKQSNQIVDPDYVVYHSQKEISTLFFQVNSSRILYARKSKSDPYRGEVIFHYRIYDELGSKELKDSGSFYIEDIVMVLEDKKVTGSFNFNFKLGESGLMKLFCTDKNRNSTIEKLIFLDKRDKERGQFYLLKNEDGDLMYENFINNKQVIKIESNFNKSSNLFARQYTRKFPISAPPFTASNNKPFDYTPDNVLEYQFDNKGSLKLEIPGEGFVFFQKDTTKNLGFTLFCFQEYFPKISSVELMIPPVRYICSKAEYNLLLETDLPKSSMDHFWKSKSGSNERAREIIRKYYGRVENANEHFSSYLEGWKTDRGMVSIIFGTPNVVTKSKEMEIWVYGDENNVNSLSFVFNKINNPFSINDYKLQRSPIYKSSWYRAVDAWRSGRVYWIQ